MAQGRDSRRTVEEFELATSQHFRVSGAGFTTEPSPTLSMSIRMLMNT